jgi:beta-lactamase class A
MEQNGRMLTLIACALALTGPVAPPADQARVQAPASRTQLAPLERRLSTLCERFNGRIGYSLILLDEGQRIHHRGDERFPSASTIKTALALEAIRQVEDGTLKWKDKRAVPPQAERQASMWSFHFRDGVELDVDGWVNLMVGVSDNTATIVMRDWLGMENTNRRMESLGLPNTKVLQNVPPEDVQNFRLRGMFGLGMTTPNEMARLLELVYRGEAASPAGCEKLVRILSKQYWDDFIGASVPPHVVVASKSGAINRSRSDTAIVFSRTKPYVLTVFTDSQKDRRWVDENEGNVAIVRMAQEVWDFLHPQERYRAPAGFEKFAPTGGGV